jgi:hypothetical protein
MGEVRKLFSANQNLFEQMAKFNDGNVKGDFIISINESNYNSFYGDAIITCLVIPSDFFSKHRIGTKELNETEKDKLIKKVEKNIDIKFRRIKPVEMERNIMELRLKKVIEMLNEIPRFWEHKIMVGLNYDCTNDFTNELLEKCSKNLKPVLEKKKNLDKIQICSGLMKEIKLSKIVADFIWEEDLKYYQNLYGNIGTGKRDDETTVKYLKEMENELPPFVRKNDIPITQLKEVDK